MQNRQIKFRVWDKNYNSFIESTDLFGLDLEGNLCVLDSFISRERFVFQQYIGLKDLNNKEIYEGDIIQFDIEGVDHGPEREWRVVAEVWYCEEDTTFAFGKYPLGDGFWYYSLADRIDRKTIKVIGNIFENPELVKKL